MKKILFLNCYAPTDKKAKNIIDLILAASVYDQDLSILFMGDSVLQLQKEHVLAKNLKGLLEFGINKFFVDEAALKLHPLNLTDLILPVKILKTQEIAEIIVKQDIIL